MEESAVLPASVGVEEPEEGGHERMPAAGRMLIYPCTNHHSTAGDDGCPGRLLLREKTYASGTFRTRGRNPSAANGT